MIFYTHTHTN